MVKIQLIYSLISGFTEKQRAILYIFTFYVFFLYIFNFEFQLESSSNKSNISGDFFIVGFGVMQLLFYKMLSSTWFYILYGFIIYISFNIGERKSIMT